MNEFIIFLAEYLVVIPPIIFLYIGYRSSDRVSFVRTALLTAVLAIALSLLASAAYDNPRPFQVSGVPSLVYIDPGNGFPSRHALFSGTIAAVGMLFSPYAGAVLWLLALGVGVGRVLANVHHAIDIVASFIIAIFSAGIAQYLLQRYFPRP